MQFRIVKFHTPEKQSRSVIEIDFDLSLLVSSDASGIADTAYGQHGTLTVGDWRSSPLHLHILGTNSLAPHFWRIF